MYWSSNWFLNFQSCFVTSNISHGLEGFALRDFRWFRDGKGLLLLDKESFCGAFEVKFGNYVE